MIGKEPYDRLNLVKMDKGGLFASVTTYDQLIHYKDMNTLFTRFNRWVFTIKLQ